MDDRGLFKVHALQNLSTGWLTNLPQKGGLALMNCCTIIFTVIWVIVGGGMAIAAAIYSLFIGIGIFAFMSFGFKSSLLGKLVSLESFLDKPTHC